MNAESDRSEQVIEGYKKHKLSISALHQIQRLIRGFEREEHADRRIAWIGMLLLAAIVIGLALNFFNRASITVY